MEKRNHGGAAIWKREVSRLFAWALLLLVVVLYPLLLAVFSLMAWARRDTGAGAPGGRRAAGS